MSNEETGIKKRRSIFDWDLKDYEECPLCDGSGLVEKIDKISLCPECGCMTKDVPAIPVPKCGKCGHYKRKKE